MTDRTSVEKLDACPYFQRAKSQLYKGTAIDEQSGYGYCYAYGTGYLRLPSVLELKEYCLGNLHFRCSAYNWLKEKGRLGLVGNPSNK